MGSMHRHLRMLAGPSKPSQLKGWKPEAPAHVNAKATSSKNGQTSKAAVEAEPMDEDEASAASSPEDPDEGEDEIEVDEDLDAEDEGVASKKWVPSWPCVSLS